MQDTGGRIQDAGCRIQEARYKQKIEGRILALEFMPIASSILGGAGF